MFVGKEEYMKLSEFWVSIKVRKSDGSFYDLEDYECSNFGKVRKLQSDGTYKEIYSREITADDNDGYRKVNIVAKYSGRVLSLRLDDIIMSSIFPQFYKPVYKVYHVDNDINNCSIYNLYLGRPSDGKKPKESVELPYDLPFEPSDEDILETAANYIDAADFENNFYELFCWANCKDLMRKIKYRQVSVEPDDMDKDDEIESGFEPVVEDEPMDQDEEQIENKKRDFVGNGFVKCCADFKDFKEGETYWLEYLGNDEYNVRSDNLLGKTYNITPYQLYTIFKKLDGPDQELERECRPRPNTSEIDKMIARMELTSNQNDMGQDGLDMGTEEEQIENEPVNDDQNMVEEHHEDPLDLLDHTSVEIDSKQNGVKFELKITAHDAESLWKALGDLVVSIRDGQLPDRRSSNIHRDDSGCRYRFDGEKLIVNVVPSTLTNEEMIDIASHYSSRKVFRRQQYTLYTYCVRRGIASKLKFKDEL